MQPSLYFGTALKFANVNGRFCGVRGNGASLGGW
jgi:hypothetical protein